MKFTASRHTFVRNIVAAGLAAAVALLSACGGGGGGGGAAPAPTPLATGTFTKTTSTAIGLSNLIPFGSGVFGDVKSQNLYAATLVGGSGRITTLRYKRAVNMAAAVTCPNTTVRIGHTNLAALTTTFGSNINTGQGSQLAVYTNATLTIPAGALDTFFDIPLATPFEYNGVDNLVVEVERTTTCSAGVNVRTVDVAAARNEAVAIDTVAGTAQHNQITGGVDTVQPIMQFVFAGGDNKVDFIAAPNGNSAPLSTTAGFQKVQMLYDASAIAGSGPITGIGLQVGALTTAQTYTYTMKLGHSSLTDLTTTWANNINVGSPVTVASSVAVSIPAGIPAGKFIWLPVPDGVFSYNGTDNLVIELTVEAATGGVTLFTHPTPDINRVYGNPASATASTSNSYTHQIALRFHGAMVTVIGTGSTFSSQVLGSGIAGQVQSLYKSPYLGTSGSVTSIAVRMGSNSVAATVPNARIYMGHTTKTGLVLADTYASNMTGQTLVFNGPINVPAGLLAGDWLTIPLQTPFAYNGTQNLTVFHTADIASAPGNIVRVSSSGTEFPIHIVGRNDNAVGPEGNPTFDHDGALNLSLSITK